ncbi:MAG: Gfo/Idh/MocA family protein [Acidobacteriota bacterium]
MKNEREKKGRETSLDRRVFIGTVAVTGAAALVACSVGSGPSQEKSSAAGSNIEPGPRSAPDGERLKAGLVGCGGRGTGAALNFLEAGPHLQITALADVFEDRLEDCRHKLKEKANVEVADDHCFLGFDAYRQLIDSGVDIVMLATPPHFRPQHFAAAVNARKHVFMEKPVSVDPVGIHSILATSAKADAFGLSVVTGTQRRHERSYIETYNRIMDGAIGELRSARCYWNQGQLWYKERQKNWSDMEYMIRDWVNWQWLSGDHIVEQHVHNLDVVNWFTNSHPVKAVGMGARMRRVTGDQYDFFDIDYELDDGMHVHSMCRQIDGCANSVSEFVVGTRGASNCKDTLYDLKGQVVWKYKSPYGPEGDKSPYVQEHIDLVTSIRTEKPVNFAVATATSTLVGIMGRISAYSGKEVSWDEMMQSDLRLGPTEYAMGAVKLEKIVPVPGGEKVV